MTDLCHSRGPLLRGGVAADQLVLQVDLHHFAHLGHLAIYLLFIALPLIGMVMMYWRGNPWYAFGLTMPYAPQSDFERVDTLKAIHEWLANAGYFVIGLHALAALLHHYWWKDNTLLRMMPRKR